VPFVITAELPEVVLRRAKVARQLEAREEWRSRQREGEVPADSKSPPGISFWEANGHVPVLALVAGFALALLAQLIAKGLGALFGFSPGLTWLWAFLVGFAVTAGVRVMWEDEERNRAVSLLEANQRTVTDPFGKALISGAHRDALAVIELWPHLPLGEELDVSKLHNKLWMLAGALVNRCQFEEIADNLRTATVGVPSGSKMARDLDAQIAQADAMFQTANTKAQRNAAALTGLAKMCRCLHDERLAVARAQQVSRQAEAVLGTVATAVRTEVQDNGEARQIADILDAYHRLDSDEDGSSAS
jgi:hypothetical protein